ncbi:MAG: hypothetical protein GEU74_01880, partial [Nitriliruptorales bacterium]|nr:hypothetical protein [Nitriliruptorales bacterium]
MSARLPGMMFDRYWPARHPGGADYAQGRSVRIRRLYWLVPVLGPLIPAILALTRPSTRTAGEHRGDETGDFQLSVRQSLDVNNRFQQL